MALTVDQLGSDDKIIGFDDKITKEQFRKFAMSAIESCLAIPDDIWESGLPTVVLRFKNSYEVIVGLRDAEDDDVNNTLTRYERALAQIANSKNFGSPLQAIAAAALGNPNPTPVKEEE